MELVRVRGNRLHIAALDLLDGTPVLDIKPYVPAFDQPSGPVRTGWLDNVAHEVAGRRSDDRFRDR